VSGCGGWGAVCIAVCTAVTESKRLHYGVTGFLWQRNVLHQSRNHTNKQPRTNPKQQGVLGPVERGSTRVCSAGGLAHVLGRAAGACGSWGCADGDGDAAAAAAAAWNAD